MTKSNRKGFTLVELLIVIVVIGVLSAMMMLSSTEAVSSARANNIVSNLRNFKTAALAWYADNLDNLYPDCTLKKDTPLNVDDKQRIQNVTLASDVSVSKYLGNNSGEGIYTKAPTDKSKGYYQLMDSGQNNTSTWWVGYVFPTTKDANVIAKLRAKASSLGLHFTSDTNVNKGIASSGAEKAVWMKVFGDWDPTAAAATN